MRSRKIVGNVIAALFVSVLATTALAKTSPIQLSRELRIDPASLSGSPRTFRPDDAIVSLWPRQPASAVLDEALAVDVYGFRIVLAKGLALTERSFVRSPNARMFSKRDGYGGAIKGLVLCNDERLALGPFVSGEDVSAFKGVPCFIDRDRDGVFEAVTFIGLLSGRELGPVPIAPVAYALKPGEFTPRERIDLVFKRLDGDRAFVKPVLFDAAGRHGTMLLFTDERGFVATDYFRGCLIAAPSGPRGPAELLGIQFRIEAVDTVAGAVLGSVTPSDRARTIHGQIKAGELTSTDWLPTNAVRCGDKK